MAIEPLVATHVDSLVVLLKAGTLVLGGFVTVLVYKAYRRTGLASFQFLAIGFGLVTAGSILAGVIDQLSGLGTDVAVLTESAMSAVGMAVILYSVYRR